MRIFRLANLNLHLFHLAVVSALSLVGLSSTFAAESLACSNRISSVCILLKPAKPFNTKEEGKFFFEIKGLNSQKIRNVRVDLWMEICSTGPHGSAPVRIMSAGENKFRVENAWFNRPGLWLIRANIETNSENILVEVPVFIAD